MVMTETTLLFHCDRQPFLAKMKKAYVCPKTRPLTLGFESFMAAESTTAGAGAPTMGNDVKGTAASGRMW